MTQKFSHPDRCFVGDEVGGNLFMKGDGYDTGRKVPMVTKL